MLPSLVEQFFRWIFPIEITTWEQLGAQISNPKTWSWAWECKLDVGMPHILGTGFKQKETSSTPIDKTMIIEPGFCPVSWLDCDTLVSILSISSPLSSFFIKPQMRVFPKVQLLVSVTMSSIWTYSYMHSVCFNHVQPSPIFSLAPHLSGSFLFWSSPNIYFPVFQPPLIPSSISLTFSPLSYFFFTFPIPFPISYSHLKCSYQKKTEVIQGNPPSLKNTS